LTPRVKFRRAAAQDKEMSLKQVSAHQFYRLAIALSLFQKSLLPEEAITEDIELDDEETDFNGIRCPLCQWQPDASSLWGCYDCGFPEYFFDGCGMSWNTFATRGVCPGCGHQWRWTSCLRCWGWSLHEEWYVEGRS
jgi:hypothetical protein